MKNFSLFFIFLLFTTRLFSQVGYNDLVINEIMHSPKSPEPEWIEIYNNSDHDIDLNGYWFEDAGASKNFIKLADTSLLILSKTFLVVSDNTDSLELFYSYSFDLLVKTLPTINNSGDELKIRSSDGTLIDSVAYTSSWGGKNGLSLERKKYSDESNSTFNWGSSVSLNNATPGMYNSISPRNYDMTVTDVTFSRPFGFEDSSIVIRCNASNIGLKKVDNCYLTIKDRTNNIVLFEKKHTNIDPGADVYSIVAYENLIIGEHEIEGSVNFYGDEATANDRVREILNVYPKEYSRNHMVINEIMYKPDDDEPEWIEIQNRGSTKINLMGWTVHDSYSKVKLPDTSYYLQAGQFLILSDKENLRSHYDTIPSDILKLSLPSFNNSYDEIVLRDYHGNTIESVKYKNEWGGGTGVSLERIDTETESNSEDNWGSSIALMGATPGTKNSITKKNYDLELYDCSFGKEYAVVNDTTRVTVSVVNKGLEKPENFTLAISNITNLLEPIIIYDHEYDIFFNSDTLVLQVDLFGLSRGFNQLNFQIKNELDEFSENDYCFLEIYSVEININPGDILINEIMFAPLGDEPEWIELYNTSNHQINLKGSSFSDQGSVKHIVYYDCFVESESYMVITNSINDMYSYGEVPNIYETELPSMNNNSDIVCFSDSLGRKIDLLDYKNETGVVGKSLERINLRNPSDDIKNWSFSESGQGGTPGKNNSISKQEYDLELETVVFTPTIPMYGEYLNLTIGLRNQGIHPAAPTIKILRQDDHNVYHEMYSEVFPLLEPDTNTSININHLIVVDEPINLMIECVCNNDGNLRNNIKQLSVYPSYKDMTLLINEIMYQPENGEPEWIELYNFSNNTINLKGFKLFDSSTESEGVGISKNYRVAPGDYAIISKNESISNYHDDLASFVNCDFETLNNDKDGVVIKDYYSNVIDSVFYGGNVNSIRGHSLERLSFFKTSTDSSNWVSSLDEKKSTPGRENSVRMPDKDIVVESITYSPLRPMKGSEITVEMKLNNCGALACEGVNVIVGVVEHEVEITMGSKLVPLILPDEEKTIQFENIIELEGEANLFTRIEVVGDEDLNNNFRTINVKPGFENGSIVISEFMNAPLQSDNEWIELYNLSDYPIDLKGWTICDVSPRITPAIISEEELILNEQEYLVLCKDPVFATTLSARGIRAQHVPFSSLGNTEDGIVLYDSWSNVIDSIYYNSEWRIERGISMERIDCYSGSCERSNWFNSICSEGCSPGLDNPVSQLEALSSKSLIVNEIMYEPETTNSEFVELYNTESYDVQLAGVSLWVGDNDVCLSPTVLNVPGNEYFVLASDSSIFENYPWLSEKINLVRVCESGFSLPNDGTTLSIVDFTETLIDSVKYSEGFHNANLYTTKNKSLERISLSSGNQANTNWSSSVSGYGATPGKVNSVFTENISTELKLSISPNPFSPDSDGFEDFTIISYNLPNPVGRVRLRIYDSTGRQVREIFNNQLTGSSGDVIFDGLDESGRPLRIGMYIVLFEAIDSATGFSEVIKEVVVVARKL